MNTKPDLKHIRQVARLMDSKFRIPGTKFRFGLDPVLGLIPGIGDLASYGVSGLIIYYLSRYGASRKVILMMMANAALDAIIGSIPIVGQIFDFTYKANERNLRILTEHLEEGKHYGRGNRYIVFFIVIFMAILVLIGWAFWAIISAVGNLF